MTIVVEAQSKGRTFDSWQFQRNKPKQVIHLHICL